jgi:multiple sugar transport system substrate-binding protein
MISRGFRLLSFLLVLTLAGCTNLPFKLGSSPQPGTITPGIDLSPTNAETPAVEETLIPNTPRGTAGVPVASQPPGGLLIRIWVPAEFDPEGNSPASALLKARLEEYAAANPELRLDVRVKAMEGAGGLLESLVAASAAAPLTLPDLVLLPRPLLESAALKGLLFPYDGVISIMDDPSWFEYARQLGRIKDSTYGIPFAADALVLAHHPSLLETTPSSLETSISLGKVILYPATDPQALFTLCMYLAEAGNLQDAQGRPSLDQNVLTSIFEYYQRASLAGVMPSSLDQYSNDAQVWEAFVGGKFPMSVTWASTYFRNKLASTEDLGLALIPTPDGSPFTLATGWSWALANQDPNRRELAVRLIQYLIEKEFLGEWTYTAGYLPPRADALERWQEAESYQVIEQILKSARLMPSADLVSSIGPALEQAVVEVLKAQSDPQTAARGVIEKINQP